MRMIHNECERSGGRTTVSPREAIDGWLRCSCGKVLKIRATRNYEASIPRHSRPEAPKRG